MHNAVLVKCGWLTRVGWCLLGGITSFIVLWALVSVEVFQPILLAPLGLINKLSWALLGHKIIPDGGWSTLYVSAYFFALGALIVGLAFWRKSLRSSNPA